MFFLILTLRNVLRGIDGTIRDVSTKHFMKYRRNITQSFGGSLLPLSAGQFDMVLKMNR